MSKSKKEDIRDVIKRTAVTELGAAFSASMESLKGTSPFHKSEGNNLSENPKEIENTSSESAASVALSAVVNDADFKTPPSEALAATTRGEDTFSLSADVFSLPENISDERLISMLSRIISKPELIVALLNILGAEDVSPAGKVIMMSLLFRGGGNKMNLPFGKFCESIGVSAHIHRNWSSGKYSHPWLVVNGVGSYNDGKEVYLHESVFQSGQGTFSFLDEVKLVESSLEENIELPLPPLEMYQSFPPIVARAVECALLLCADGSFEPEMLTLPVLAWFVERNPENGEFLHTHEDVLVRWMTLCERKYEWKKGTNTDIMTKRLLSIREASIGKHLVPVAERLVGERIWNFMMGDPVSTSPSPELLIRWNTNQKNENAIYGLDSIHEAFMDYCSGIAGRTMARIASCISAK